MVSPGARRDRAAPTVILVGGSFTMGHGVTHEESFAGQLETMSDFPYQIVNLGVQAFGTDQALLQLKRHFRKFNTQAVVYTFINDHVSRNHNYDRRLLVRGARFVGTKPLFGLRPDGSVVLDDKRPLRYADYHYSRIWALVQQVRAILGPEPTFELTDALIQEMKRHVESNGATFLTVHWRSTSEEPLMRNREVELIDTVEHAPPEWDEWRIPGDGHPTPRAHAFVARLIAERLLALLQGTS